VGGNTSLKKVWGNSPGGVGNGWQASPEYAKDWIIKEIGN